MKIENFQDLQIKRRKFKFQTVKTIFRLLLPAAIFLFAAGAFAQTPAPVTLSSAEYVAPGGLAAERLIEFGQSRRADLQAARARLAVAEAKLTQAGVRPNPTLDAEYGSPRFLGGEAERDLAIGVSQTFELGGKRSKRRAVAELELQQTRAEVSFLERQLAVEIRTAYATALAAARQLDVLEKLVAADEEIVRAVEARLKEGDVAPLDVNLVRVEAERLKVQIIQTKSELQTQLLQLKNMTGADVSENLRLAPQAERPPRLDLNLSELTELALNQRADLQAARIAERLGEARINLARAGAVPNVAGSIKYSHDRQIFDFPAAFGGNSVKSDNALTFGISIEIPIFNRNQGEIAVATGEKTQAARQREFLEAQIKRDAAVAYRKYRAAAEQLVIFTTQILPRSEENLKSVRAAYGLGEFSVFEVVGEQRRLTENVTGYNQALRDYYTALAELEAATGAPLPPGGFSSLTDSVLPDERLVPNQTSRERLLKSIEKVGLTERIVLADKLTKKQENEEKQ